MEPEFLDCGAGIYWFWWFWSFFTVSGKLDFSSYSSPGLDDKTCISDCLPFKDSTAGGNCCWSGNYLIFGDLYYGDKSLSFNCSFLFLEVAELATGENILWFEFKLLSWVLNFIYEICYFGVVTGEKVYVSLVIFIFSKFISFKDDWSFKSFFLIFDTIFLGD